MPQEYPNALEAALSISPSTDFRTTVDTARFTKAIMLTATATATTVVVTNDVLGATVTMKVDANTLILPMRTKAAVTSATYTAYYLY